MTAVMTTRADPFTDAVCREPGRLVRWWDVDARADERELAALLCVRCPAKSPCADLATSLGDAASGTYAGVFLPWSGGAPSPDDEALAEYLHLFGPSAATTDNPMPTTLEPKPLKVGRYWIHPSQLVIEYREAN